MTSDTNQNSQFKALPHAPKDWLRRIAYLAFGGVVTLIISCCVFAYLITFSSDRAAYALVPQLYPNSSFSGKWVSGGTDSQWDRRTYRADASPETIAAYYKEHFIGATYRLEYGIHYFSKCDESPIAKAVARWINEGRYPFYTADNVPLPCVIIYIEPDDDEEAGTPYQLNIEWPSL